MHDQLMKAPNYNPCLPHKARGKRVMTPFYLIGTEDPYCPRCAEAQEREVERLYASVEHVGGDAEEYLRIKQTAHLVARDNALSEAAAIEEEESLQPQVWIGIRVSKSLSLSQLVIARGLETAFSRIREASRDINYPYFKLRGRWGYQLAATRSMAEELAAAHLTATRNGEVADLGPEDEDVLIESSQALVVIWDGVDRDDIRFIGLAQNAGVPITVIMWDAVEERFTPMLQLQAEAAWDQQALDREYLMYAPPARSLKPLIEEPMVSADGFVMERVRDAVKSPTGWGGLPSMARSAEDPDHRFEADLDESTRWEIATTSSYEYADVAYSS